MNNGRIYCLNSSTILEEDLRETVLNNIKKYIGNTKIIKDTLESEIEAVISKNDKYNTQVIRRKLLNYEKEVRVLKGILKELDDKQFYIDKIKNLETEIGRLKVKEEKVREVKKNNTIKIIERLIDDMNHDMDDCFDVFVRNMIDKITVGENTIKLKIIK